MKKISVSVKILIATFIFLLQHDGNHCKEKNEIFKTDIGDQMTIGLSDKGYKSVKLKCGSDSMLIELETEDDFEGVIYTRGSFHDRDSPCFFDPGEKPRQRKFKIKFPLDKCHTKKEGESYSNVLVLQHDKDLIMPGDAAFNLECDFNKPRDVTVNANLQNEKPVVSRITLTDADPAYKEKNDQRDKRSIANHTNTVILTQEFLRSRITI